MITVFDIGARYGIHETWSSLFKRNQIEYFAFEIDAEESNRLKKKYSNFPNYKIFQMGFSDKSEEIALNVLSHKGQSSFLEPNLDSKWFGSHRKNESEVVAKLNYKLSTLFEFAHQQNLVPDFLKIDTEGYDLKVLHGSIGKGTKANKLIDGILAISCEVYFEKVFENTPLFGEIFEFLNKCGFTLANLKYDGRGIPASYFCPNPGKYGFISGCEAVFIKNSTTMTLQEKIKLVLFCFYNQLEDYSNSLLIGLGNRDRILAQENNLWPEVKYIYALSVKKLMYIPGDSFEKAKIDYQLIFNEEFPEMHHFYESDWFNPA